MTVLTREDIHYSASETVDDLLRQVPWFSLFRRSSSLVTHPTTQGVSLRGIGPSGGAAIGGCLGTLDNGELRFAAYARRKRLTSPEPSTRLGATWLRVCGARCRP